MYIYSVTERLRIPTNEVVLSLAAMFTLSPNKQYCGIFSPTRPAATGPKCIPAGNRKREQNLITLKKHRKELNSDKISFLPL